VVESVRHIDPARTFSSAVPAILAAAAVICLVTAVLATVTAVIRSPDPAGQAGDQRSRSMLPVISRFRSR